MYMYNQGTLTGTHKRELVGGFTLEQETEGRTEKVNFDEQRLAVFAEFLNTRVIARRLPSSSTGHELQRTEGPGNHSGGPTTYGNLCAEDGPHRRRNAQA